MTIQNVGASVGSYDGADNIDIIQAIKDARASDGNTGASVGNFSPGEASQASLEDPGAGVVAKTGASVGTYDPVLVAILSGEF